MAATPRMEIIRVLKMSRRSQRWLAREAGVHETAISLIVNGRLIPNDRQVSAIAGVLGIDPQILFS